MEKIIPRVWSAASRVATRSAINPLLWLTGIISPVCFLFSIWAEAPVSYVFLALGALPIVATIAAYAFFMIRNPRFLQSESYQLRQHMLERYGDEGYEAPFVDAVLSEERRTKASATLSPPRDDNDE